MLAVDPHERLTAADLTALEAHRIEIERILATRQFNVQEPPESAAAQVAPAQSAESAAAPARPRQSARPEAGRPDPVPEILKLSPVERAKALFAQCQQDGIAPMFGRNGKVWVAGNGRIWKSLELAIKENVALIAIHCLGVGLADGEVITIGRILDEPPQLRRAPVLTNPEKCEQGLKTAIFGTNIVDGPLAYAPFGGVR